MGSTEEKAAWRGQVRMPAPLADWLKARAAGRYRSMNAEIVDVVLRAKDAAHAATTRAEADTKRINTSDIERRALLAYRRGAAQQGATPTQPGACEVHEIGGNAYARLSNVNGVLAVYRVHRSGKLQGLKDWPLELN